MGWQYVGPAETAVKDSVFCCGRKACLVGNGCIASYAELLGNGLTLKEHRKSTMRQELQAIKKEARGLLRALQRNDFTRTRLYRQCGAVLEGNFHARLADAQYIVARRYGFKSWASLQDSLSSRRKEIPAKFTTTAR